MSLKCIKQRHESGCFIACVAMLLGKSYNNALRLIHPNRIFTQDDCSRWVMVGLTPEESLVRLAKLGVKTKPVKIRKINSLKKDALLLMRWSHMPDLMHALVYDASTKKLLDPSGGKPYSYRFIENQLEQVLYIEK